MEQEVKPQVPIIESLQTNNEIEKSGIASEHNHLDIVEEKIVDAKGLIKFKTNYGDPKKNITNNNEKITKNFEESLLLGSVTTFTPTGGLENPGNFGQTVRTSARVIQKMKLDSIRPPTPPPNDKKEQLKDDRTGPKTPNQSKSNRSVWSNTEKNFFFEALNEYGKDFESIAHYINTKSKRKNSSDMTIKSREQIRVFYYQSYQKVSKYLKFSDDVKKLAQELYALINYGEMRKKLIFVNEKLLLKLRDLVYKGWVTIRAKGKNVKIKTPSCKALRQLNQLEEWQEEIKLPPRIEIFLKPANVHTWGKVQSLAQNPRVKTTLPIQRRVSSLLKTLQYKWRSQDFRTTEKIMSTPSSSTITTNPSTQKNVNSVFDEPKIRIIPTPDAIIHRPMVNLTEFLSSYRICLNSYEDRIGVKVKGETLCSERINTLKEMMKTNTKRQRLDSNSDVKKSPDHKKNKLEYDIRPLEPCDKLEKLINTSMLTESNDTLKSLTSIDDENEKYISDSDILTENDLSNENKLDVINKSAKRSTKENKIFLNRRKDASTSSTTMNRKDSTTFRPLISDETIKKIREGWTISNIGDMTFGDLYIMFGSDFKLNLEYLFIEPKITTNSTVEISSSFVIEDSKSFSFTSQTETIVDSTSYTLGNKLKQLLLIANMMEHKKAKPPCVCGHICDRTSTGRIKKLEEISSFISNRTHSVSQNDNVIFRPPTLPIRQSLPVLDPYKHQANMVRNKQPRWIKSRNRTNFPAKQVIVQRLLPLHPGVNQTYDPITKNVKLNSSEIKSGDDKEQNIIKSEAEKFKTTESNEISNSSNKEIDVWKNITNSTIVQDKEHTNNANNSKKSINSSNGINNIEEILDLPELNDNQNSFIKNINDNIGIKNLMDISLPSPLAMDCDESRYDAFLNSTPSMSPMKIMKNLEENTGNTEWLTPDINDFSFSSFLGHLDSLAENSRKNRCNNQLSIDSSNLSVISESSVDYMTKFAQITAELKEQENNPAI